MRFLYLSLLAVVAIAFIGAAILLVLPVLTRDGAAFMTVANPDAPAATLTVSERRDLRPDMPTSMTYTPDVTGAESFQILDGVSPRRWWGYAPDDLTGPAPLILLFHGEGRGGLSMIDMWQGVADENGLVLVAIDDIIGAPGDFPDGGFLQAVIAAAAAAYPIDRARMFLFGHSAGAITAQLVANRVIGPWRGVAAHAGYVNPDLLQRINDAPPIRLYLGTSDRIFDVEGARIAGDYMARAGHEYDLVLIPGHTHWFYEGGPAFAADAWAWFQTL
jgi:acetyl esterase/lipase